MPDKKNTLFDIGLTLIRKLVAEDKPAPAAAPAAAAATPAEKKNLDDIKLDDLNREKIRLEQEERKILSDLKKIESEKRKLFEEGVRNASQREQLVIGRRIRDLDQQATNMDRMLQAISKQLRIINGLAQLKERVRINAESGLASIIASMDLGEVVNYVDRASVDGEFQMSKFDDVLRAMEKADAVSPQYTEEDDVLDIVRQMQMAREAADDPAALEQHFQDMNRQVENRGKEAGEEEL
jgi:hypothetical protein